MLNICDLHTGEWEHFLYVGKIALFGWILHFRAYLVTLYARFPWSSLPLSTRK